MMKCNACGAPVEHGKCTYCGKAMEVPSVQEKAPSPMVEQQQVDTKKKASKKNLISCKSCGAEIAKSAKGCPQCGAKNKKSIFKKWWFWVILIFLIGSAGASGDKDSVSTSGDVSTSDAAIGTTEDTSDTVTPPVEDNVSQEFKSALKKAKTYSSMMHMSKAGIYGQLTSEYGDKFPVAAAEYAMEHLDVDYKENALDKAETYSKTMRMSKVGIYGQLISEYGEKFTEEEAQYAIDNLEADYKANALSKAKTYQETMSMSRTAIYDQLTSAYGEQFTAEEAQYAVDQLPE